MHKYYANIIFNNIINIISNKYSSFNNNFKGAKQKMNIKKIRLEKGLSVSALSRLSGVPVRTIEDIERRGDCKVSTAIKLASALLVSLDYLCGYVMPEH